MRYAYFDESGGLISCHDDQTISVVPNGALEVPDHHWEHRELLRLNGSELVVSNPSEYVAPAVTTISARQIRLALNELEWRQLVEAAVSQSDQNTRDEWQYASSFERGHPAINAIAAAIGKTQTDIDQLFELAGSK